MAQLVWRNATGYLGITNVEPGHSLAKVAEDVRGLIGPEWELDHTRDDANHFTIPDMQFIDALTTDGTDIVIRMDRARDVWRNKIREARKPKLDLLDVAYQRADEVGDASAKAEIAAAKQLLRDLPDAAEVLRCHLWGQ